MEPITFCIATAKNEKEYVKLLLKSLKDHTDIDKHEILVFIDSDNQNTHSMLLDLKQELSNLKICLNTNTYPVGGQRNVSLMFNAASNDIVCYLQSDMVVGKDFDKHINDNIDKDTILSCARIEPPLHPESPEKIVKDFGITPETFDYNEFNKFVDILQSENRPNLDGHFAPFAIYKSAWFDLLGGFDTQFRCSREDSDTIIRMNLCGLKTIQSWNACVYHFTCVSSRGTNWYEKTPDADYKNLLQQYADLQELKRFIRKWGFFGHQPKPVYDITFNIEVDRFVDMNLLKAIEPYCKRMFLSDKNVAMQLASQLEFEAHYYSNLRWNYTLEEWNKRMYLFNPTDFYKRIQHSTNDVDGDVIVTIKYSKLIDAWNASTQQIIENIHQIVDQHNVGLYQLEFGTINILRKNNLTPTMHRHNDIDILINDSSFEFN